MGFSMSNHFLKKSASKKNSLVKSSVDPDGRPALPAGRPDQSPALISCGFQTATGAILSHGYDRLELSLYASVPCNLISLIRSHKTGLQSGHLEESLMPFGGIEWLVQRTGVRNYPYVLKTDDIVVCLSSRGPDSQIPSVSIRVGSVSSQVGAISCAVRVQRLLEHHGMHVLKDVVSRFDYAVDLRIPMANLERYLTNQHLICRGTYTAFYYLHKKLTGLQVGKGDIVCRIYDKSQELKTTSDIAKQMYFKEKYDGNLENIVRVEFQLRGGAIRDYLGPKRGAKNLQRNLQRIWADLTENWLRVSTRPVVRSSGHQRQEKIAFFWKLAGKCVGFVTFLKRRKRRCVIASEKLIKQAVGCLTSVVAQTGQTLDSIGKIMTTMEKLVREGLISVAFTKEWQDKYLLVQASRTVQF